MCEVPVRDGHVRRSKSLNVEETVVAKSVVSDCEHERRRHDRQRTRRCEQRRQTLLLQTGQVLTLLFGSPASGNTNIHFVFFAIKL